ncbi:MAG: outer membrane protein assembly factor BamD [Myxococcales bacterium]|nr:outer membrane protein assembly factor BamD [Myxococcales bacterium]
MRHDRKAQLILAALLTLLAFGCKGTGKKLTYQGTARRNYYVGIRELVGENYPEAQQYFSFIKKKYDRFTPYYVLAELRLADVAFYQEKYSSAITQYKQFLSFYPTNPNVPYAMFRIGHSYFKQIPDDWFFMPATWQRDQSNVEDALRNLRRFVQSYPKSKFVPAAKKLVKTCRRQLYLHERYVTDFYHSRKKYHAVIQRLERIFTLYPDMGRNEQTMYWLGESYVKVKQLQKALTVFTVMQKLYPKGKRIGEVKRYISRLTKGS